MRRVKSKDITLCKNQKCKKKNLCIRFVDKIDATTKRIPVTFNEIDCSYFIEKTGKNID